MIHKVIKAHGKAYFLNARFWGGLLGNYKYYRITQVRRDFFDTVVKYQRVYNPAIDN